MTLKQFPKVKYPKESDVLWNEKDSVTVLEKQDGASSRFTVTEDEQIILGSRNVVFTNGNKPKCIDEINNQFQHVYSYLMNTVNKKAFMELASGRQVTVFGEAMHTHQIEYDSWDGKHPNVQSNTPNFVVFDIYVDDTNEGRWLSWDEIEEWSDRLGLETTQKVSEGSITVNNIDIPQSMFRECDESAEDEFDRKGLAEGVVLKDKGDRAKIVHQHFNETKSIDEQTMEGDKEELVTFIEKYITENRVSKKAHELKHEDEYDGVEMRMMNDLHEIVFDDALEEATEFNRDDLSNDEIDEYHGIAADKIATHIQNILQS